MAGIRCGGETFRPGKVLCIGMNYPKHVGEMAKMSGQEKAPVPQEPVIFTKPPSAILLSPAELAVPAAHGLLHHEVELCALLGAGGRDLSEEAAGEAVAGWAVGLDLTLRTRQLEAKKKGRPWALAKGFDGSCVLGDFRPREGAGFPPGSIRLRVNGTPRQDGSTGEMVFQPAAILCFISRFMTLERGDVLMCGTPEGVGPLEDGDEVEAVIEGLPGLRLRVLRP